ncbi:MAG: acyl-CoA thioesterase II [Gammaproteobacteria bacterium]|nr:acyl-CoA thioesterase II [Gammaproteobacteria bacterium]MDH4253010.1 acyl-CoA thioesterase II [Gammaproteobacteria bacterium]MDH5308568.1 acyl-CoA thioesterase II [Gammaproteobacteria bacterium]
MSDVLEDLIQLLRLERIEDNIYRGQSRDIGSAQVFGGQVLGQALSAAHLTVEGRVAHSLHAYFLRRGDMAAPIVYEVDRARDGGSFSVRRVVAIQHGRPIFNMAASFQVPEEGIEHQATMPEVDGPEGLPDVTDIPDGVLQRVPEKMRRFLTGKRPFEFRPVRPVNFVEPEKLPPSKHVWIRAVNRLPDDPALHQNLLAYVSDYELLGTSTLPHGLPFARGTVQMASLDHALWFHRPCRVDEWMLYSFDTPNAGGARGFARGQIFTRSGALAASTAQEGLVRVLGEQQSPRHPSDPRLQV